MKRVIGLSIFSVLLACLFFGCGEKVQEVVTTTTTTTTATTSTTLFDYSGPAVHVDDSYSGIEEGTAIRPYNTVQEGVDNASGSGLIKVAGGTYNENVTIPGTKQVVLVGGYSDDFTARNLTSRIMGNSGSAVISMNYSADEGTVVSTIDGFTIDNGQRGIFIDNLQNGGTISFTIINNIIENNSGLTGEDDYGGGIFLSGVSATVSNNTIRNNQCGKGAGLYIWLREADRSILVQNNVIQDNISHSDHGGGVYIAAYKGKISGNTISGNRLLGVLTDGGWGGGMIVDGDRFTGFTDTIYMELSNNVYRGNSSPMSGSCLFIDEGANVRMSHELIYGNISSEEASGGLYVDGEVGTPNAKTIMTNCTIADNIGRSGSTGHAIFIEGNSIVEARDSIFWGNRSDDNNTEQFYVEAGSSLTITYSDCQGGYTGTGNINADPLFAGAGDYHLKSTAGRYSNGSWLIDSTHSPCIDAGDPSSPYANEPTPNGDRVNMGTYGNTSQASKSK